MKMNKRQRWMLNLSWMISIGLCALLLGLGFLTGNLFFARPAISSLENRTLAAFPALSWNGFWDGSWFNDVSLWYADTFPGREGLVASANRLKDLYGIQSEVQVYGDLNTAADTIPLEKEETEDSQIFRETFTQMDVPENYDVRQDVQDQIMQGSLVYDGSAYGIYYYVDDAAKGYIQTINKCAKDLKGITNVFVILVPNNSGVMLPEDIRNGTGGSDQKQAINYYYSHFSEDVIPVETIDILQDHNDEYLYFHSDHHWTGLGAYYAYVNFAKAKGLEPHTLEEFQTETFSPFLGSYRSLSTSLQEDAVTGYVPMGTNETTIFLPQGEFVPLDLNNPESYEGKVFNTDPVYDEYSHYLRFINGDQGLQEIHNTQITDGSSCVVVKESYGNAFVPFLVDHYEYVYVIDYRYAEGSILDFCKEHKITDLLFVNNIQIIGNISVVDTIQQMLQPAQTDVVAAEETEG